MATKKTEEPKNDSTSESLSEALVQKENTKSTAKTATKSTAKTATKSTAKPATKAPRRIDFAAYASMETGNTWADSLKDNVIPNWYDTGSYALNVLISGDMTKGIPSNRAIMLAGETSTGKSFFARGAFARALALAGHFIFVVDSENEYTDEAMQTFGIPKGQYRILKEDIVENVRFQLDAILRKHEERRKKYPDERIAIIIDSQGYLDTLGARVKTETGKTTKDMTLQREIKGMYKTILLRSGTLECPICIINHVYQEITSHFPATKVTGGQGGLLASSVILTLRRRPLTSGAEKERVGILVTGKTFKSRITLDGQEAGIFISYRHGMSRWYGVHNFAEEAGLVVKWSDRTFTKKGIICKRADWIALKEDMYVIKDPKISPEDWLVVPLSKLHSEKTIGTIFNEINEYVVEEYKLGRPIDFDYDPVDDYNIEIGEEANEDDDDNDDLISAYDNLDSVDDSDDSDESDESDDSLGDD